MRFYKPLCCLLFLFPFLTHGQEKENQEDPLSPEAYRRMMRQLYSYTILGNETPSTGFKVETTKPTITLKGVLYASPNKKHIWNLDLTAGVEDNVMQLLSGKKLNTNFKIDIGYNFLTDANTGTYVVENDGLFNLSLSKIAKNKNAILAKADSFLVLKHLLDKGNKGKTLTQVAALVDKASADFEKSYIDEQPKALKNTKAFMLSNRPDFGAMIKNTIISYGIKEEAGKDLFQEFSTRLFPVDGNGKETRIADSAINEKQLIEDYNRLKKYDGEKRYDEHYALEIETFKDIWVRKRIFWINTTLTGASSLFKLLDEAKPTLIDTSSFSPAISGSANWFFKYKEPHRFWYSNIGVRLKGVNNLDDLKKFDYKKEDKIAVSPTEELKSEKTGTAYKGILDEGFGFDIFSEHYFTPFRKGFIPGFYGKLQYSYGDPWINNNKIALDLGVMWNVTNDDKEAKNLLSIVPYASWTNLIKEYTDATKTEKNKLTDQFLVGIKFGIPVNLQKSAE